MSSASFSKRKLDVFDDATSKRIRLEPRLDSEPTVTTNRVVDVGLLRTVDVEARYSLTTNPITTLNMPGLAAFYDCSDATKFTVDGSNKVLTWTDSISGASCTAFGAGGGPVRDGANGLVFTGTEALRATMPVVAQYSNGNLTSNDWVIAVVTPTGMAADTAAKTSRALVTHPTYKVGFRSKRVIHTLCSMWDYINFVANQLFIGGGSVGARVYYIISPTGGGTNVLSCPVVAPLAATGYTSSSTLGWSSANGTLVDLTVVADGELWTIADISTGAGVTRSVWHYASAAWASTATSATIRGVVSGGVGASYYLDYSSGVYNWTGAAWAAAATTGLPVATLYYLGIFMRGTVPFIIIQANSTGTNVLLFWWDSAGATWVEISLAGLLFANNAKIATRFTAAQGYRGYTAVVGNKCRRVLFIKDSDNSVSDNVVATGTATASCGLWPAGALLGMRTVVTYWAYYASRAMLWGIDGNDHLCRYDFTTIPSDGAWTTSNTCASTLVVNAPLNTMTMTYISASVPGAMYIYSARRGPLPILTGLQADVVRILSGCNSYMIASRTLGKVWLFDAMTKVDTAFDVATYGHAVDGCANSFFVFFVATAGVLNAVVKGTISGAGANLGNLAAPTFTLTWTALKTDFDAPIVMMANTGPMFVLLANGKLWCYDGAVWTDTTAAFVTANSMIPQGVFYGKAYTLLTGIHTVTRKGLLLPITGAATADPLVDLSSTVLGNTADCQLTGVAYVEGNASNRWIVIGGTTPCNNAIMCNRNNIAGTLTNIPLGSDLTWFRPVACYGNYGGYYNNHVVGYGDNGVYTADITTVGATFAPAYWPSDLEPGYGCSVNMGIQMQPFGGVDYALDVCVTNDYTITDGLTYLGPNGDFMSFSGMWQSDAAVTDTEMAVVACSPQTTMSIGSAESYATPLTSSVNATAVVRYSVHTGLGGSTVLIGTDDEGVLSNFVGRLHAVVSLARSAQTTEVHAVMRWLSDKYGVVSLGRPYIPELPMRASTMTCDIAQSNVDQTRRLLVGLDGSTGGTNISESTVSFYPVQPFTNQGGVFTLPPAGASIVASAPNTAWTEEVAAQCDLTITARNARMQAYGGAAVAAEYASGTAPMNQTLSVTGTGPADASVTMGQPFRVRLQGGNGNSVNLVNPAATNTASSGGDVLFVTGTGGGATIGNVCVAGAAGTLAYSGASGGTVTAAISTATGGVGGGIALACGAGGSASTINGATGTVATGGKGGSVAVTAGTGSAGSGAATNVAGAGGDIAMTLGKSGGAAASGGTLTVANYAANEGSSTTRVTLTPVGTLITAASLCRAAVGTASLVLNGARYMLLNTVPVSIVDVTALVNALGPGPISICGVGFGTGGSPVAPVNGAQFQIVAQSTMTVVLTVVTAAVVAPAYPIVTGVTTVSPSSALALVFFGSQWLRVV